MDEKKLHDLLIKHENIRLVPYRCSMGKLTIGVGHNLDDNPITCGAAMHILEDDISECISDISQLLQNWQQFPEARQAALVDMRFNLGPTRFRGFDKMLKAIDAGLWDVAAVEALDSRWAGQVGARAQEVATMLLTGKW